MSKPANVHAFFAKLAAAVGSSTDEPSLSMLHSCKSEKHNRIAGSLQDVIERAMDRPKFLAIELRDYGVGLPPMAYC